MFTQPPRPLSAAVASHHYSLWSRPPLLGKEGNPPFTPMFRHRLDESEIMDDLSRPEHEFAAAYRELEIINKRLGGVRAIERFLPGTGDLLLLDVAAGACDVSE